MAIQIEIDNDRIKLSAWIRKNYPGLSAAHLAKLCRIGEVRVNGGRCGANRAMVLGDKLKLPPYIEEYKDGRRPATKVDAADAEAIRSALLFQTPEWLAIDKPAGIATQGGSRQTRHIDAILPHAFPEWAEGLRLVHRLDMDTSGVLVAAKTYEAAKELTRAFKEGEAKKTYLALAYGMPDVREGVIDKPVEDEGGRLLRAVSRWRLVDGAYGLVSLLEFRPETGRTHQLRIHAASMGHPIVGDFKYAREAQFAKLRAALDFPLPRRLMLHAWKLKLPGAREVVAPVPEHILKVMKYLNFSAGARK